MLIRRPSDIPASEITPHGLYRHRREFIQAAGALAASALFARVRPAHAGAKLPNLHSSPFSTTTEDKTPLGDVTTYNNYYEFGTDKDEPSQNAHTLKTRPWTVAIEGEVKKPRTLDIEALVKLAALEELNAILKLHRGKYVGLTEQEVRSRLEKKELEGVHYRDEWLVNILDDLEEEVGINVELDARVYKFDVVTFDFEKTSARAMLQTMADSLLFKWIIRGDTLYVYKEMNEVLFDEAWLKQQRAIWKKKREEKIKAAREADEAARKKEAGQ